MSEPAAYLDAASSEPLHPAARDVLLAALEQGYADPRRLHAEGRRARLLLDNARDVVAQALGLRADEISFTPSGTDAVHRGLLGLRRGGAGGADGRSWRVAHPVVEHSAVLHALEWSGGEHPAVGVDSTGRVGVEDLVASAALADAVAVQAANHEVGTVQPVAEIVDRLGPDVPVFVDACAAMGRVALPTGRWSALAGSAHKWGGPAGVGVLVVRKGTRWVSPFPTDDRTDPRASGFENVPAALAAAAALQAVVAERDETDVRQRALVDRVRAAAAALPDTEVVGDPVGRLPHLVTFSCLYVAGDAIVHALAERGFGVASGSACTATSLEPSHVLAAMGALTHGNVRVSLTRGTSLEDVDALCRALPAVVAGLRS